MTIKTNTTKAAEIILYTAYSEHGEFELCMDTYTDGSAKEVISGKFAFCGEHLFAQDKFGFSSISGIVRTIRDIITNRYVYISSDYETEYDEFMEYAECFEFIATVSKQLRVFQGVIEA